MKFVTWGANLGGGFLRSTVEQTYEGSIEYNYKLAQLAEELGVEAMLFPIRYVGKIGGNDTTAGQLDPLTTVTAVATKTQSIRLIAAVLPGFIHPATLAKISSTIDVISNGRFHINLVSGWFKAEQEAFGIDWIEHSERYKRSYEYLQVLKGLWTENNFTFNGEYYQIHNASSNPKPIQKPYPAIYQGGNSLESQELASEISDYYFMNGAPIEELKVQIENVKSLAAKKNRTIKFAVAAFVIARNSSEEAQQEYSYILENADEVAISQFKANKETKGMWKNATSISDFVANNEGFRTGLIGSYDEVAKKLNDLKDLGIEKILVAFRDPMKELPTFFEHVVPKMKSIDLVGIKAD